MKVGVKFYTLLTLLSKKLPYLYDSKIPIIKNIIFDEENQGTGSNPNFGINLYPKSQNYNCRRGHASNLQF